MIAVILLILFTINSDNCSSTSLVSNSSCTLSLQFSPPSSNSFTDTFDIPSNDPDQGSITIQLTGNGVIESPIDSNGDGISDRDALRIGLNPLSNDGDSDNDGLADVIEVGDIQNPTDTDGDGVIDALEPGSDATKSDTAGGLRLHEGGFISIKTETGNILTEVSTTEAVSPPNGVEFPFGVISYTSTADVGSSITVRLTFSSDLPSDLLLYKVDSFNNYIKFPNSSWVRIDIKTLELTLTDGDNLTDLDGIQNGIIVDPIAVGTQINSDSTSNTPTNNGSEIGSSGGGSLNPFMLVCLFLLKPAYFAVKYRILDSR